MSTKAKQVDPIPDEFASYEEAAEFWDTHDTTDYLSSFETVSVDAEGSSPLGGGGLEQGGGQEGGVARGRNLQGSKALPKAAPPS
jgi:hypothetical protein